MFRSSNRLTLLILTCCVLAIGTSAYAQPVKLDASGKIVQTPVPQLDVKQNAAKLPVTPYPKSNLEGFYEEIPLALEPAVRHIAQENYTSASDHLLHQLSQAQDPRQRARILMWLGIMSGQLCLDNPSVGPQVGTSATLYLLQALKLDPDVLKASDVVRILAEMSAHGWSVNTPQTPIIMEEAERRALQTKNALDYFYAGVMIRREAIKQWLQGDTSRLDKRAYRMLSLAVEADPTRYELWSQYLPSMMPVELHVPMTTESIAMLKYFEKLRNPLIADTGPIGLHIRTRQGFTVAEEDAMLERVTRERPSEPFAHYQLALWAIETTPTLAVQRFEKFIADVEAGTIKLLPKESGFYTSALYKLAFLYEEAKGTTETLRMYEKVASISPSYAEVKGNLASLYTRLSDDVTTSAKIPLLEKALVLAQEQERNNYRGKAAQKAIELRRKIQQQLRKLRQEVSASTSSTTGKK